MQYRLNVQAVDIGKVTHASTTFADPCLGIFIPILLRVPRPPQKVERRYDHFLVAGLRRRGFSKGGEASSHKPQRVDLKRLLNMDARHSGVLWQRWPDAVQS